MFTILFSKHYVPGFLLLFCLNLFTLPLLFAQQPDTLSIEDEIRSYEDSRKVLISKGRNLLIDKFLESDFDKVIEIMDFFDREVDKDNYIALWDTERWMLYLWLDEYKKLFTEVIDLDLYGDYIDHIKIYPTDDLLYEKLLERSFLDLDYLLIQIEDADLEDYEVEFSRLLLLYFLSEYQIANITGDTLNSLANNYIQTYPETPFEFFIRKYIRFEIKPSNWGFAFDIFLGYGNFTRDLSDYFSDHFTFGIAWDITFRDLISYFRIYMGTGRTLKPFDIDTITWYRDVKYNVIYPEIALGYPIFDNKRIRIFPSVGIAFPGISPTTKESERRPEYEDLDISGGISWQTALNIDLKFGEYFVPHVYGKGINQTVWLIRLRFGYDFPGYYKKNDLFNGGMYHFTIGFGGLSRRYKRVF